MAKRMTDSTKWDKAWFWHLPMVYKLFWVTSVIDVITRGFGTLTHP